MSVLRAPRVELSWPASALGAAFGGYRIYRRPARAFSVAWELAASITVPAGYSAATVEAQHVAWHDYEAGWAIAGGQWADGFDYTVTVVSATTGIESLIGSALDTMNAAVADANPWVTCNVAPYLNFPVAVAEEIAADTGDTLDAYHAAGRDLAITRAQIELPERTFSIKGRFFDRVGEDALRPWRAAAQAGLQLALMLPRGDRIWGAARAPAGLAHEPTGVLSASGGFVETSRAPVVSDYNLPAGLALNGSTQAITVPHNAIIDATGAFSVVVVAAFGNAGASRYALSKGSIAAAANGYALRTNGVANQIEGFVRGASGNGATAATAAAMFDGNRHAAIFTSSGTAQALYLDDAIAPAATSTITHGSLTNAIALAVGADNAGASSFMAMSPAVLVAYYQRALTPVEAVAAARAGLGYPGVRLPANPSLLVDLRDDRTWKGYGSALTDLSAIPPILAATAVGSPATRGLPWALSNLDRFS